MTERKSAWTVFLKWLIIIIGSIGILFALFCVLTQWKFITVSTEGISITEIYQGPNDIIIYRLNVPEGRYATNWKFEIKEDGSGYQIPKRSIIELHKNVVESHLNSSDYMFHDQGEMNHAQFVTGGPAITSWHLGAPDNAVLIWEEGMVLEPAPYELLVECGLHVLVE